MNSYPPQELLKRLQDDTERLYMERYLRAEQKSLVSCMEQALEECSQKKRNADSVAYENALASAFYDILSRQNKLHFRPAAVSPDISLPDELKSTLDFLRNPGGQTLFLALHDDWACSYYWLDDRWQECSLQQRKAVCKKDGSAAIQAVRDVAQEAVIKVATELNIDPDVFRRDVRICVYASNLLHISARLYQRHYQALCEINDKEVRMMPDPLPLLARQGKTALSLGWDWLDAVIPVRSSFVHRRIPGFGLERAFAKYSGKDRPLNVNEKIRIQKMLSAESDDIATLIGDVLNLSIADLQDILEKNLQEFLPHISPGQVCFAGWFNARLYRQLLEKRYPQESFSLPMNILAPWHNFILETHQL